MNEHSDTRGELPKPIVGYLHFYPSNIRVGSVMVAAVAVAAVAVVVAAVVAAVVAVVQQQEQLASNPR